MNKMIITLVATLPALALAGGQMHSQPFTGFNAGLGLGLSSYRLQIQDRARLNNTYASSTATESSMNWASEVFINYHYQFNQHWLAGAAINYQYNANNAVSRSTVNSSTSIGHFMPKQLWGLTAQLGFAPSNSHYFYFEVGPEWLYTKVTAENTGEPKATSTYTKPGLNIGLGMVQSITDHWFVAGHINYYLYPQKTLTHTSTASDKVKAALFTGMLDIGYRF